jgi:hypothetical protein
VKRVSAIVLTAAALTGCGSSESNRPAQPRLPLLVAEQLAVQSDRVAAAMTAGNSCTALDEARRLRQQTVSAINAGRIPGPFQEQLGAAVNDLVARIECVPPPPAAENEGNRGKGKKGKGHKGKHGKGDD